MLSNAPANGLGRLCVVSAKAQGAASPFASVSYGYDVAGRIISSTQTTDSVSYPFSYTYDLAGKVEAMTLPSGRTVTSCYDRAGRMKSVTGVKSGESARAYVSQASYDSGGGLDRALLGNGRWEDRDYNERKQVLSIKLGSTQGAGDLLTLGFGYGTTNNNGNVLSQTIARPGFSATQTYTYDAYNRIQKVQEGTDFRDFAYKEPGNLYVPSWSAGAGWAPGSFTPASPSWFDGNNRMVNTALGIQYDAAGNQTAIGGFTFAYDAENRLVSSTLNSVTTTYAYDGEGRRVKKGTVVMVYDAFGRLAAEYGGTADPVGTEYLTADHLGSTRLVTSSTGAERRCLDYLPFGEQMTQGMGMRGACYASASEPRVKFTGKERDAETGLDLMGERYFSFAQGRFTSPDVMMGKPEWLLDPQRWNRYAYVRNNPLKYIDPNGEDLVIYYSLGRDVSEEDRKWFEKNKQAILSAIRAKYEKAGVKNVSLRDQSTLSKEQIAALDKGSPFGVSRLIFVGKDYPGLGAAPKQGVLGYAHPDGKAIAAVFLDTFPKSPPAGCDYVCMAANVGAHEVGHTLGMQHLGFFEEMADRWRQRPAVLGGTETHPDLMTGSMGTPTQPLFFKPGTNEKTRRAIEQLNRIGDMTPQK